MWNRSLGIETTQGTQIQLSNLPLSSHGNSNSKKHYGRKRLTAPYIHSWGVTHILQFGKIIGGNLHVKMYSLWLNLFIFLVYIVDADFSFLWWNSVALLPKPNFVNNKLWLLCRAHVYTDWIGKRTNPIFHFNDTQLSLSVTYSSEILQQGCPIIVLVWQKISAE